MFRPILNNIRDVMIHCQPVKFRYEVLGLKSVKMKNEMFFLLHYYLKASHKRDS